MTLTTRRNDWLLGAAMVLVFAYLLMRSIGLYPAIFADELIYATFARLLPLQEATIPNYLYFALFGSANACGASFLDCARGINALLFVASAPFIYSIAGRFTDQRTALFVTVMSLLLPVGSYTAYFMPESLYFFAFFVLTWVVLNCRAMHWAAQALVSGLILGAMTLIKVHALFLIAPLCLFAMFSCWSRGGPWVLRALASAAIVMASTLAVKFGLGYLMGGPNALHLFGAFYGSHADNSATRPMSAFLIPLWENGRAHLMALAILFGLPLVLMLHTLATQLRERSANVQNYALHLYALLMLGAALAMTVVYTASLADVAPREHERLHMRYYDFAFPLLLMVAATALGNVRREVRTMPVLGWIFALLLAGGIVLGLRMLPSYALSMADGPDIAALFLVRHLALALGVLQVVALGLWAFGRPVAARVFLFVFFPLMLLGQNAALFSLARKSAGPSAFDSAGLYVRDHVPKAEHKDVVVAAHGLAYLMRAKFHIDEPAVSFIEMAPDAQFNMDNLPVRHKWLLVVAPHKLAPELTPVVATKDFALVKVQAAHRRIDAADFSTPAGSGLVAAIDGVDKIEPWGRWSNTPRVTIRFNQRLPRKLNLLLKGQSYGPNAELDYVLRVGGQERRFRIGRAEAEVFLRFDTDGMQESVTIDVPKPISPQQFEGANDPRTIGLGLMSIEVGERP